MDFLPKVSYELTVKKNAPASTNISGENLKCLTPYGFFKTFEDVCTISSILYSTTYNT